MILDSFNIRPEDCREDYKPKKHWFVRLFEVLK
jgi:hypothetical protein